MLRQQGKKDKWIDKYGLMDGWTGCLLCTILFSYINRSSITVRPLFHTLNTLLAQLGAPNTPKRRTVSLATRY